MSSILGVIGGMGPEATALFYEEVIAHTKAEKDQEHIDMVILSHASMPDRTQAILSGREDELLKAMRSDVGILETAGAANIAIPCNTSHYFYDRIQAMTAVPIINMVRESVRSAASLITSGIGGHPRIGIMATDGTVRTGVYHRECEAAGYEAVVPSEEAQKDVMSIIYDDIKGGRTPDRSKFSRAYDQLKSKGCSCIILACTELSVYTKYYPVPADCLDAMDILVRESILRSGAQYIDGSC